MLLTPSERDRLLLFTAAQLARSRRARGLRLNAPEATALIADTVAEAARDGRRLAEAIAAGRALLGPDDILPGVADIVPDVQVEAVFDDGTRLAVVTDPFGVEAGSWVEESHRTTTVPCEAATLSVRNSARVPISVTSHFHLFEVNPRLRFDRAAAYGMRLAIPAGATIRFDPGASLTVPLVPVGGDRVAIGFAGLVDGPLDAPGAREKALEKAREYGYMEEEQ